MISTFLQSRWNGEAELETVFWRDMLLFGTLLNLAASGAAMGLLAADYAPALALIVNFAPIPVNLFLAVAVWRSAEREGGPPAVTAKVIASFWFIAMVAL